MTYCIAQRTIPNIPQPTVEKNLNKNTYGKEFEQEYIHIPTHIYIYKTESPCCVL